METKFFLPYMFHIALWCTTVQPTLRLDRELLQMLIILYARVYCFSDDLCPFFAVPIAPFFVFVRKASFFLFLHSANALAERACREPSPWPKNFGNLPEAFF